MAKSSKISGVDGFVSRTGDETGDGVWRVERGDADSAKVAKEGVLALAMTESVKDMVVARGSKKGYHSPVSEWEAESRLRLLKREPKTSVKLWDAKKNFFV